MAGRRAGDSASPPSRKAGSRRSGSSSSRSPVQLASRSPSPRSKRLRRAQEYTTRGGDEMVSDRVTERDHFRRERDSDRLRERDNDSRHQSRGRDQDFDRGRVRDRDSRRDKDSDRGRGRDLGRDRDSDRGRDREKDRERTRDAERGREKEQPLSRERSPDRRGRQKHSPSKSRVPRASSPTNTYQKQSHSSPRKKNLSSSPPHRSSDRDKAKSKPRTMRDEVVGRHDEEIRLDGPDDSVARMRAAEAACEDKQKSKEKPSFEYSGKLAAETNKVRGVALKFTEPAEARKPTIRWRLYIFKDGEPLNEPLYIHRQSCYLFGRERRVVDVPTDHPSCSKQHAVIQYRLVEKSGLDGTPSSEVRPYIMDLGSTNGTFINGERIDLERYYELFEQDTVKFGNSSREYVLLHEHSAG